jgi:hypothetical protein
MTAISKTPLSVEQDLADSPWWAGNARLTKPIRQITRRPCCPFGINFVVGVSDDAV